MAAGSFDAFGDGGGIVWLSEGSIADISHELFHGYQFETGLTEIGTISAEVGAYLFQDVIQTDLMIGSGVTLSDNPRGQLYDQAHLEMLYEGYTSDRFETAVNNFKFSARNPNGLYDKQRTIVAPNPAIKKFIPIK